MSGRSRRTRKPTARVDSAVSNSKWTDKELNEFFGAYGRYGSDWLSVVRAVSNHSTSDIQTLFKKHEQDLTKPSIEAKAFIAIYKQTLAAEREAAQARSARLAEQQAAAKAKKLAEAAEREQPKARPKAAAKSSASSKSSAAEGLNGGGGPRGTKRVRNSPAKPPPSPSAAAEASNRKRSRKLFAEELAAQEVTAPRQRSRPRKLAVKRWPIPAEAAGFYETARPAVLREDLLAAQEEAAAAGAGADPAAAAAASAPVPAAAAGGGGGDGDGPAPAAASATGAASSGVDGSVASAEGAASTDPQNEETTNGGRVPRRALTKAEMHWCVYDSFYAGIDQPFFTFCEFRECLIRMGLPRRAAGPVSRGEWNAAKRRLQEQHGVPRRFSNAFCKDEHERLVRYRERAREQLNGQRAPSTGLGSLLASHGGSNGGMDTPALLHVGQPVVAIHPKDRLPHFGKILTAEVAQCRVQFDRGDLGVQLLSDADITPFNDMVLPWADGPMLLPQLSALAESAESQMKEDAAARPPPPAQVVVDLRIPTETLKLLDQKEKLVAGMREVSNKAAHAAELVLQGAAAEAMANGAPPTADAPGQSAPPALIAEFGRLMEDLRTVDTRLGPLLVHMRRYTAAATGTIAIEEVPQAAEVEGATSSSEKLIEQLRTTCTTKATDMMVLAAKDPKIAAGRAASGDDLTENEKGKILSLVSKCVAMIAALQHLGQYIASEQRQSLIMQGQRQATLDALDAMMAEMQQSTLRDSGLRSGEFDSAMQTFRQICG